MDIGELSEGLPVVRIESGYSNFRDSETGDRGRKEERGHGRKGGGTAQS